MESFRNNIHDNEVIGAEHGVRLSMGSGDNTIQNNILTDIELGETTHKK